MNVAIKDLPAKSAYVSAWRRVKGLAPDVRVKVGWGWDKPAVEVALDFRIALDKRINIRGGLEAANVPMDVGLERDARRLDDILKRRIRHYSFESAVCRKRFSHLLARHDD